MQNEYPKVVVIVPESFGGDSSSSHTLGNLFLGWPPEKLVVLAPKIHLSDQGRSRAYWQVRFPAASPLLSRVPLLSNCDSRCFTKPGWKQRIPRAIKNFAFPILDLTPLPPLPDDFLRFLAEEFQPELIYSWLGSLQALRLTLLVSEASKALVIPHFMDDWLTVPQGRHPVNLLRQPRLRAAMERLLPRCVSGIAISEPLALKYEKEFSLNMTSVSNGVSPELIKKFEARRIIERSDRHVKRVLLLGRLDFGREKLIIDFIRYLQRLPTPVEPVEFLIATRAQKVMRLQSDNGVSISILGAMDDEALVSIACEVDILIYLDSFEEQAIEYFRHSFSGKIPLYLALGRPILIVGPADMFSVAYLKDLDVGIHVASPSPEAIFYGMQVILKSTVAEVEGMSSRARSVALKRHSVVIQRERLIEVLRNARP